MALRMVMRLTPKCLPSSASVISRPVLSIEFAVPDLAADGLADLDMKRHRLSSGGCGCAHRFRHDPRSRRRTSAVITAACVWSASNRWMSSRASGDRNGLAFARNVPVADAGADSVPLRLEIEQAVSPRSSIEIDPAGIPPAAMPYALRGGCRRSRRASAGLASGCFEAVARDLDSAVHVARRRSGSSADCR